MSDVESATSIRSTPHPTTRLVDCPQDGTQSGYVSAVISWMASLLCAPFRGLGPPASKILCSPFTPFLAVTFGCNLSLIYWSYQALLMLDCDYAWWMWGNAIFALLHINGSMYIVVRMRRERELRKREWYNPERWSNKVSGSWNDGLTEPTTTYDEDYIDRFGFQETTPDCDESTQGNVSENGGTVEPPASYLIMGDQGIDYNDGEPDSYDRLGHILCYDVGIAMYMVVCFVWVLWQSLGVRILVLGLLGGDNNDDDDDDGTAQCDGLSRLMLESVIVGSIYTFVVVVAFDCALLCLK